MEHPKGFYFHRMGKCLQVTEGTTTPFADRIQAHGYLFGILEGHKGWIYSVSFSPDGNTLASGSDGGRKCGV